MKKELFRGNTISGKSVLFIVTYNGYWNLKPGQVGGGGVTSDFKWQGWLNGGTNPKKSLEQNLTPEIPCWITEQ